MFSGWLEQARQACKYWSDFEANAVTQILGQSMSITRTQY